VNVSKDLLSAVWIASCVLAQVPLTAGAGERGLALEADAAWPCEQALVAEVSAAVVWDGPPVDGLRGEWRKVPPVAELVPRLAAPRADPADSEARIEAFARLHAGEDKDRLLTLLFAGVLESLNEDRRQLNSGILRYARDQERRAKELDRQLVEGDPSGAAQRRLGELKKRLEIEQRVFDDREKAIPFLCTRPRSVEQRMGEIARAIAYRLD
jgi:hypothetical protein